ncbi:MAG: endonuclease/exonuclease/phosphatase family protein [Bacteroidia bacterium]|jgi:endonuclease/exonuclease/phosphatase family metal-dependent hydrolase
MAIYGNTQLTAQVPKVGNDTLIEMATWNIEWFGDTQNGPTNESLQFSNVKSTLTQTDLDIWSFCEISNPVVFQNLLNELPAYASTLVTYSQTQKTALIWKKSLFSMLSSQMVLTESQYDYDLAGRPPLEVVLVSNDSLRQDTLYIYVIHLKAFADQTSYTRRKNAAALIRNFIATQRATKKVMVMGDWNDKVVGSIYSGTSESPFKTILEDTAFYRFASKQLADEGKKSYTSSNGSLIDHILFTQSLDSFYVKGKALVLDMLPSYISSYSSTTSDHYPVMATFNFRRYSKTVPPVTTGISESDGNPSMDFYPNPVKQGQPIFIPEKYARLEIMDFAGKMVHEQKESSTFYTGDLNAGIYWIRMTDDNGRIRMSRLAIY